VKKRVFEEKMAMAKALPDYYFMWRLRSYFSGTTSLLIFWKNTPFVNTPLHKNAIISLGQIV